MSRHLAQPGDWAPGYKTMVNPKSEKGLPTDIDRTREQALPPGSATPGGGGGRDIPTPSYNTPDNDIDERPRTKGTPGEEYGNPTKFDYGSPTRRHEVASVKRVADAFLEGRYTAPRNIPPLQRQQRQRGKERSDSRQKYIRNRPKKVREMKERHEELADDRNYQKYKKWYNDQYRARGGRGFRRRGEGITFTWEQEAPNGDAYHRNDPTDYERKDIPPGGTLPDKHLDDADPSSSRVVPSGDSGGEETYMKSAATMDDIAGRTSPDVHARARSVKIRLRRADAKNGIWTFEARGSKGNYLVRVKGLKKGTAKTLEKLQVKCSCDCDFFRYQGPEHWAKVNGYLYGKPRGTATAPKQKDPRGQHWACKHVLAALNLARRYRVSSEVPDFSEADILPDYEWADQWGGAVSRLTDRYLGNNPIPLND